MKGGARFRTKTSGQSESGKTSEKQEEKDILVVFSSPELLNDIFGIADHGLDFLLLWWRTQLSDLHFFFILK